LWYPHRRIAQDRNKASSLLCCTARLSQIQPLFV
jgi:hypothetical protein